MDLISSSPFWPIVNGLPQSYPRLGQNLRCEVAVVGAGITGALVADTLAGAGRDVVVVDKRDVGSGSTSASTALLQYEIDVSLVELTELLGRNKAARAYQACARSIDLIADRVAKLGDRCGFEEKQSVFLASNKRDARLLSDEVAARQDAGLAAELWSQAEVEARFSFSAPAAIHSAKAAQIDPYRFTHALLARAASHGARIFDRTPELEICDEPNRVKLQAGDLSIHADWVVIAAGYEAINFLPRNVVSLKSSFAIVSEPIDDFPGWWDRCLLWETKQPYFYARTTPDGRAIIGGEDDAFRNPARRDRLIPKKAKRLAQKFSELFPSIPFEVAYAWAGTFGETKDGLAYIGASADRPRVLFACGFGGNGITFSALAAEILHEKIGGQAHADEDLFAIER